MIDMSLVWKQCSKNSRKPNRREFEQTSILVKEISKSKLLYSKRDQLVHSSRLAVVQSKYLVAGVDVLCCIKDLLT